MNKNSTNLFIKILLVALFFIYLFFGLNHLSKFFTPDEHYWIFQRVPQYWSAIKDQNWQQTRINDKPGISLALFLSVPQVLQDDLYGLKPTNKALLDEQRESKMEKMLVAYRLPIILTNGFFVLLFFWLLLKITGNKWIALWAVILIALSPVLLGISQIVNPDAFLWSFFLGSLLSFWAYLKTGEKKLVLLATFFTGMCLLTKYVSLILLPFLFFSLFSFYFFYRQEFLLDDNLFKKSLKKNILSLFMIMVGSFLLYSILFPAVAFNIFEIFNFKDFYFNFPDLMGKFYVLTALFFVLFFLDLYLFRCKVSLFLLKIRIASLIKLDLSKILYSILIGIFVFVLFNWNFDQIFSDFTKFPFDLKKDGIFSEIIFWKKIVLEFYPLVFSLTPVVLILVLANWIRLLFKESKYKFVIFTLSFFVVIFYLQLILLNVLATIRYGIIVYPLMCILAAVALWELFGEKINKIGLSLAMLVLSFVSIYFSSPYYFNYTSFLLPKNYIITDAWGYGGYEAAAFLNDFPNAENMVIWSDYAGVCEFFKGKCFTKYLVDQNQTPIDYYVLTRRGKIRYDFERKFNKSLRKQKELIIDAKDYYTKKNPVWSLEIDGRNQNYIKIYKKDSSF